MQGEEKVFVYSEKLVAFVRRAEALARYILQVECRVEVRKTRFLYLKYTYPLDVVVFDGASRMGYFDPVFFEIGINQEWVFGASEEALKNLLRHELAHYLHWIETGFKNSSYPHDSVYRAICMRYGWGKEVYKASGSLQGHEGKASHGSEREQGLISKVKKLIALAGSSNIHEAELATRKANELITKYNLSHLGREGASASDTLSEIVMKRILPYRRISAKHRAIRKILETFGVRAVFATGCLSVAGLRASVEVAEYVGVYLERHFETLYRKAQEKDASLKGVSKKNSFFIGIGNGYVQKIEADQQGHAEKGVNAGDAWRGVEDPYAITPLSLVRYRKMLADICHEWVYGSLHTVRSGAQIDAGSLALGKEAGQALTIATPLTSGCQNGAVLNLLGSGETGATD